MGPINKLHIKISKVYDADKCIHCGLNIYLYKLSHGYNIKHTSYGHNACMNCFNWAEHRWMPDPNPMKSWMIDIMIEAYNKMQRSPLYNSNEYFIIKKEQPVTG